MSLVIWILTVVRIAIAAILGSLGISTILATAFRSVYAPLQGEVSSSVGWMAKPLAVAFLMLALAFLISRTLTKFQKFIIVTIVFVISVMSMYSLVSGMDWTASLQAQGPGFLSAPIDYLKQVTTTVQAAAGV
jgi:uncharacterized membrane protein